MAITREIRNFDLRQIADSGQCFRMNPVGENTYSVISGTHVLSLAQDGNTITFDCNEAEFPFWENYFDLQADYGTFISSVLPSDRYLRDAAAFGSGIRILRQDLWEMIITFIISQQKTIPNIKALVETLSRQYGTRITETFYAFPTPSQLSRASLEDLLALKLGYRAKYINRVCEDACSGTLDLTRLTVMDYSTAMEYLQQFFGIGVKVANCVCLFGLHHIDAFPIDTWIRKILLKEYAPQSKCGSKVPQSKLCEALIQEYFSQYAGYAGVMQQYIFYYERNRDK